MQSQQLVGWHCSNPVFKWNKPEITQNYTYKRADHFQVALSEDDREGPGMIITHYNGSYRLRCFKFCIFWCQMINLESHSYQSAKQFRCQCHWSPLYFQWSSSWLFFRSGKYLWTSQISNRPVKITLKRNKTLPLFSNHRPSVSNTPAASLN